MVWDREMDSILPSGRIVQFVSIDSVDYRQGRLEGIYTIRDGNNTEEYLLWVEDLYGTPQINYQPPHDSSMTEVRRLDPTAGADEAALYEIFLGIIAEVTDTPIVSAPAFQSPAALPIVEMDESQLNLAEVVLDDPPDTEKRPGFDDFSFLDKWA